MHETGVGAVGDAGGGDHGDGGVVHIVRVLVGQDMGVVVSIALAHGLVALHQNAIGGVLGKGGGGVERCG